MRRTATDADIDNLKTAIKDIKDNMVTKEVLEATLRPINKFIYGFAGFILIAVLAAVLKLVIKQ